MIRWEAVIGERGILALAEFCKSVFSGGGILPPFLFFELLSSGDEKDDQLGVLFGKWHYSKRGQQIE